jgi:homoserine dehydrogenase
MPMQFPAVYTEGISKLTREDIQYAEELGYRIKLLGIAKRKTSGIELRVHPTLIPTKRLIANVEGVMNAILVKGDAVGQTMFYGAGAGAEPTASAVVADLIDVARTMTVDPEHRVPHLAFQPDQLSDVAILPMGEVETSYYLRLRVHDKPGVLADITRILADLGISIDAMVQKEPHEGEAHADIIMLTHRTLEKHVNAAIALHQHPRRHATAYLSRNLAGRAGHGRRVGDAGIVSELHSSRSRAFAHTELSRSGVRHTVALYRRHSIG